MTRKDFEAIAHVLDANVADIGLVFDFANMLAETNERFNRELFIKASTIQLRGSLASTGRMLDRAEGIIR